MLAEDHILTGWFEHFSNQAIKKYQSKFDLKYLKQVEEDVAVKYAICLNLVNEPLLVTDDYQLSGL